MIRQALPVLILVGLSACGGSSDSGGGPGPTPTPTPSTFALSGSVTDASTGAGIGGATVTVIDGPATGRSATTDGAGTYAIANLAESGFTARARAQFYSERSEGVTLNANRTQNFSLQPIPLFSRAGTGDTVFDMPTHIRRIRVVGTYTGFCQNFIVLVSGDLLVNEILGTCSSASGRTYDAIRLTTGGVVEIRSSSGVRWTFTEVR